MKQLKAGDPAPNFQIKDIDNNPIALDQYKGRKVMLSFYRYASCPLCNLRINDLNNRVDEWKEKGLDTIAVFQSPSESIKKHAGKSSRATSFPIIPDNEQKLYKMYGVSGDWVKFLKGMKPSKIVAATAKGFLPGKIENDMNMIPADFLIDENGMLNTVYYGKDSADHLDLQIIDRFVNN
ncbi:MAG: peroxiredoxin family protein [Chitinophagales bacterium]